MLRVASLLCVLVLAFACDRGSDTPTPAPTTIDRTDLSRAVLGTEQVGNGWDAEEDPGPNTVQIGGTVGAANVRPVIAQATSAFDQTGATGFVSNTLLLVRSEAVARAVITSHEDAAKRTTWEQERDDGGRATFAFSGSVDDLAALGDEMFAARLKATITSAGGESSDHVVEYVVYSVGPVLAFVVTQDVGAGELARRLEPRVTQLVTSAS